MRVAYICADPGIPVWGRKGCSIHVQEVLRAMKRLGAKIDLFAARLGGKPPKDLESIRVFTPLMFSKKEHLTREKHALAINSYFRSFLQKQSRYDLVYERYSLWNIAGMVYAKENGTPSILEVNSPLIEEQIKYRKLINKNNAEAVARIVFNKATYLFAVSNEILEYLKNYTNVDNRAYVLENGIRADRFPTKITPSVSSQQNYFTVGFVGTLKKWHGLTYLIEAFSTFHNFIPNSRLLIIGDGPEKDNILKDVKERNLSEAVCFYGAVNPDEIPGLLASMDVATAPYPNQDNFYFSPLKIFEYMAAGLPTVASEIGQIPRIIKSGENGLLVKPGDSKALTSALLKLYFDKTLSEKLGLEARSLVLNKYTWNKIVNRMFSIAGFSTELNLNQFPKTMVN